MVDIPNSDQQIENVMGQEPWASSALVALVAISLFIRVSNSERLEHSVTMANEDLSRWAIKEPRLMHC